MVVRDAVGRRRYVAFRLEGGGAPRAAVDKLVAPTAQLTRFDGAYGILRTSHAQAAPLVARLADAAIVKEGVRMVTLRTSGTMKGAARALPTSSTAARRGARPGR